MPTDPLLQYIGLMKETVLGTYAAPSGAGSLFLPYDGAPKPHDVIEYITDDAVDANVSRLRAVYQGNKDAEFSWDGKLYPEAVGPFLVALGLADTVTGAGPYTHTHKVPAAGTQPPSYSITDYDGVNPRGWPGAMLDQLQIKVPATGPVTYTVDWKGWPSATQSAPTVAEPTSSAFLTWQNQLTIGGVASTRLISGDITFKRNAETIHTAQNSQAPKTTWASAFEVDASAKLLYEDTSDLTRYLTNTQPTVVWTMTQPGGGSSPVLTITFTKAAWTDGAVDKSGKYTMLDVKWSGVYNATDGGPVSATLLNGVSTAY